MSLPAADIARLAAWLAQTDLAALDLRGPGVHLRLHHVAGTVTEVEEPPPVTVITAPSVGHFLAAHPLHDHPLAPIGTRVAAGQAIALLRVGPLLLPVTAPCPAIVVDVIAAPGAAVGYGTPLIALHPLTD